MANIFTVPDDKENFQSHMVFVLTLVWSVLTAVVVSLGFFVFPELWPRWLTFVGVSVFIAATNLSMNHFGYTRAASWSLVSMLWLYVTIPCFTAGGMSAPGILIQPSVILTAGFLLGRKGAFAIGLLTLGADLGLALIEISGNLPVPSVTHAPGSRWLAALIPFGSILALQYYATDRLHSSLLTMQTEIDRRKEAERLKDRMFRNLEERVKELRTLYAVSRILQDDHAQPKAMYDDIVNIIATGWQHADITAVRMVIGDATYTTSNFQPSKSSQQADIVTQRGIRVELEVVYLATMPAEDEGPFLHEERSLINMLVEMIKVDLDARSHRAELQEAAESIRRSEELLQKVTSQVPANTYMFTIDDEGRTRTLFFNRGSEAINHSLDLNDPFNASEKLLASLHADDQQRWNEEMLRGFRTQSPISVQYRIHFEDQWRWRWFKAIPEMSNHGEVIWYGAAHDITPFVDYIVTIEQMIFDISHVIRRPIASMLGLTKLLLDTSDQPRTDTRESFQNLHHIADEIDTFIHQLNTVYSEKRKSTVFHIDTDALIDKRHSFFVR